VLKALLPLPLLLSAALLFVPTMTAPAAIICS
jgi:hypothetical protein